jgi:hypothetical protein
MKPQCQIASSDAALGPSHRVVQGCSSTPAMPVISGSMRGAPERDQLT